MLSENDIIILFYFGGTFFVALLVVFLLTYVYLHQIKVNRFVIELKEQELKKQHELFIALNEGEEKERKRLAEELHDGIGAKLSGLKMSMEYLRTNFSTKESKVSLLQKITNGMDETIEELREISQNLKPSFLNFSGLKMALEDLVFHFNNKGTCKYQLYIEEELEILANNNQTIYRIVSELLNNIQRHSNASLASFQIIANHTVIQILVEDNGQGFNVNIKSPGIGLTNIKNRVELYKGKLNIDSNKDGTIVIIEFPIEINEE